LETVKLARNFDLIGGSLIAGDSTKMRAQNSKKNNYNQKKIDRHLKYIERKLEEYRKALADNDGDKDDLENEVRKQQGRRKNYLKLEKQLKESGQTQISASDPESRHMIIRNNITEVAYNVQATVDDKHNLPIDYKVTNNNDSKAMGNMLRRSKSILRSNQFTALYDKGYHTGSELAIADSLRINTLVAIPTLPVSSNAPNPDYNVEHFIYDSENDTYLCPQGHILKSNGYWHSAKNSSGEISYRFKNYTTKRCKTCPVKGMCTRSLVNGKQVRRSEFNDNIENNKRRVQQSEKLYKRRQAIVEHPFGTIKRQWGFNYIVTKKGMQRANADVGFMMIAYNLRRMINILGIERLREYLASLLAVFMRIRHYYKLKKSSWSYLVNKTKKQTPILLLPVNKLYLILNRVYGSTF